MRATYPSGSTSDLDVSAAGQTVLTVKKHCNFTNVFQMSGSKTQIEKINNNNNYNQINNND